MRPSYLKNASQRENKLVETSFAEFKNFRMDIDLEDLITEPAKKPVFKKKKILFKDKRVKKSNQGNLDLEPEKELALEEDAPAEPESTKFKHLSRLKGTGGFRKIKKLKYDQPSSNSVGDSDILHDEGTADHDVVLHIEMLASPDPVGLHIDPLPTAVSSNDVEDPVSQLGIEEKSFAPPEDIYDLDLPIDLNDEDEDGEDRNSKDSPLIIKPIQDQIEFLQDHIFVLKDAQMETETKIDDLNSRILDVKAKKQELLRAIHT